MMQIFRNMRLAVGTVKEHLYEAPFVLVLQVIRKVPSGLMRPIARVVSGLSAKSAGPTFLIASHAAGDIPGLIRRFEALLDAGAEGERARKAAEVAIAAGQHEWADVFLPLAAKAARTPETEARRKWYDGDMTGAVGVIEGELGAMAKQRMRLESELRVYKGWRPSVSGVKVTPERRRVMHLLTNSLPHTGSGYAQRTHSILAAQQEAGWEVLAATRLGYPVQIGALTAREFDVVDGIRYERILPAHMEPTMEGRLQQQTSEVLSKAKLFKPSVIHTTTHFVNGLVAREVAAALDIPWVYEVRGQLADTWASSRGPAARTSERYELFTAREAETMHAADLVVTLGESMKRNIAATGVPEDRILISPNAVGGPYLSDPPKPTEARRALGLSLEGLYVGTVSSLVSYEGLDDLVTSFALLAPRLPQLNLILVGDGAAAPGLRDQVRRLGLGDRTIFTGRVPPEQARLYHSALDVFVVPRKDLPVTQAVTPLKPVEALASGVPVVASDLSALREIVHDGVNGRLTKAEDPGDLAEVLFELLEDEGLRRRLGAAGRENVLATRTWRANARAYGQAYESLASNYRRRVS
ncbi:glycosyltransferase family 4 protein [Paenarthrobacter sp. AR 02]|uniref:glycosyltransferase family 4 protein n=1 Tax=Paenarthrobacter sp. AR 02 TaxID=2899821 RepID=UPI001F185AD4|nr:glycosyltransferase family 4 protein [Paenarthrobacter sp. AR 02]MCF3137978.1 glycosyltransferase family 4 protein [Paenarthrobacter sp. AR 02]